jgi:hypothetical protein
MSRLEEMSIAFREAELAKNTFKKNNEYTPNHPNALSTGDEPGKGENANSIGGLTDIKTRASLLTKNKYNSGNEYNDSNA